MARDQVRAVPAPTGKGNDMVNEGEIIDAVSFWVKSISGDPCATVTAQAPAGREITLLVRAGIGGRAALIGRYGETWRSLERLVRAAAWRSSARRSLRLLLDETENTTTTRGQSEHERLAVSG
jgi:predicted RNA-binding protein YlqC (UPF0109 family)